MVIYQLTNVDDKFIMIKSFFLSFLFYSLPMGSIESKLGVNLSMMNLSQLSHSDLASMLPGHRIKSYGLIECDKLYPLTDANDKFSMIIFHVIKSLWEIGN
jgi:fucose permease